MNCTSRSELQREEFAPSLRPWSPKGQRNFVHAFGVLTLCGAIVRFTPGVRPGSSRGDREAAQAPQGDGVAPPRVPGQPEPGHAGGESGERAPRLQAGQGRPQAEVRAAAEGKMADSGPLEVEPVG